MRAVLLGVLCGCELVAGLSGVALASRPARQKATTKVPALDPMPADDPSTVGDEAREHAKVLFDEGELQYKLGRFEQALGFYSDAYETMPLPALLFNIAQCHKQLGDHERAVFFYRGYLKETPDAWNKDMVEELLAEEEAALATQREENRQAAERKRLEEEQQRRTEAEARAAAAEEARRAREAEQAGPPLYEEWWFWTAIGGAALVVAAGTITTVAVVAAQPAETVLPYGTLGTIDTRGE